MKLKDFNNKLKHTLEALSKAREDEGLSPQSKKELRTQREKFARPDPISRMVSTVKPGVSDVGIEARRADPNQPGVISHGYARVLEPKQHAEIAKVKAKKILEALKRQKPLPLPKSEMPQADEIVLVKHDDGTADLISGSDVSNDTLEEFIKVKKAAAPDIVNPKDPILNYDKKGPVTMPHDQQKKMAAKVLDFMKKKAQTKKSEDLNKNKYLKEMMHQMRAEKQAKKDAALKEFHAKKQAAPAPAAPEAPAQPGQKKLFDPDLSGTAPTKVQKAAVGPRIVSGPVEINRTTISEPMKISGPTVLSSDDSNQKVLGNLMSKLKKLKRA